MKNLLRLGFSSVAIVFNCLFCSTLLADEMPSETSGESVKFLTMTHRKESPRVIASSYLKDNATFIGIEDHRLVEFKISSEYRSSHSQVTHIVIKQSFDGIEVANSHLNINIDENGRVINIGNRFIRNLSASITSPSLPDITPIQAILQASRVLDLYPGNQLKSVQPSRGQERQTLYSGGGISQHDIPVKLAYLARLMHEVLADIA